MLNILLIDTDVKFTHFLKKILSNYNIKVVGAFDVAKNNLKLDNIDLLIIDENSVKKTSEILCLKTVSIIMLTTNLNSEKITCLNVIDFINKSSSKEEMACRIEFNIKKRLKKKNRFSPEVFDEIKACLDKNPIPA